MVFDYNGPEFEPETTAVGSAALRYGLRACGHCENVNPKHSKFCENCGKRLITVSSVTHLIKERFATLPKKVKDGLWLVLFVVILMMLLSKVTGYIFDPVHTVEKYCKALANDDFKALYDSFGELPESPFVNKELYAELNENTVDNSFNGKIINYQITPNEDNGRNNSTDKIAKYYTVSYSVQGTDRIRQDTVTLIKREGNKFLSYFLGELADKWAVAPKEIIADNYRIAVLKGAAITLNGIEVGSEYLLDENSAGSNNYYGDPKQYDNYLIPIILSGNYEVTAKLSYSRELKQTIRVETNGGASLTDGFVLETQAKNELEQKTIEVISQMYSAVIEGKDFSAVKDLFAEASADNAEYSYNNLFSNYHREGRMLKTFSAELSGLSKDDVQLSRGQASVRASCEYSYTIEVAKGWSGDEFETVSNSSDADTSARFVFENGKWLLADLNNLPSIKY
ncbi:MAG: hypothetical protein LBS62_08325 [Clostridiales bacterium]|jgi:hypothetical protein|nr:hypothetical protein [Clostridiales bacterium]